MASGGKDSNVISSDEDTLHPVGKRRRRPKVIESSESDEDSDVEMRPKRRVKPLDYESEDSNENKNTDLTYSSEPKFRKLGNSSVFAFVLLYYAAENFKW